MKWVVEEHDSQDNGWVQLGSDAEFYDEDEAKRWAKEQTHLDSSRVLRIGLCDDDDDSVAVWFHIAMDGDIYTDQYSF